jgi:zinc/manganese transport system ATP-binding protein
VVFVTHDVNPVLGMVDRVLYLAGGRFRAGTPDEVLRSDVLTDLYGTPVEVIRSRGRIVVVGIPDAETHEHHAHTRAVHPEPAS